MNGAVGDHLRYRPGDSVLERSLEADAGTVYRVVGRSDNVTLLRVTDGAGRRHYTGEVVILSPERVAAAFDSTENPDAGLALRHRCRTMVAGAYWSIRQLGP